MSCPNCEGNIFTLKSVILEEGNSKVTYVNWFCDDCKWPLPPEENDKLIDRLLSKWERKKTK